MSEINIRKKSVKCIYKVLRQYPRLSGIGNSVIQYVAKIIENSCFVANANEAREKNMRAIWDDEFLNQYSNILYSVLVNLDPGSLINSGNSYLIDMVCTQIIMLVIYISKRPNKLIFIRMLNTLPQINLDQLGIYHHDILNPEANKKYKEEIELRSQQSVVIKTTKMYVCPGCNGRDSKYHIQQTRSGDEGYTVFITCQICGLRYVTYS